MSITTLHKKVNDICQYLDLNTKIKANSWNCTNHLENFKNLETFLCSVQCTYCCCIFLKVHAMSSKPAFSKACDVWSMRAVWMLSNTKGTWLMETKTPLRQIIERLDMATQNVALNVQCWVHTGGLCPKVFHWLHTAFIMSGDELSFQSKLWGGGR